jgi:PEP-CTERM motif
MKKSIFIAVLGVAASVASSYGQGSIFFSSYTANDNLGATTSFFNGSSVGALAGIPLTAQLYYALGTVSDPVNNSSVASIMSAPTGLTLLSGATAAFDNSGAATGAAGLGYYDGGVVTIPGYVSGPVTFEIVSSGVFNGQTYDGRSGSWTESSIAGPGLPAGNFGDAGVMPNAFVATVVPEPTTLALAGLGGLASLVALRRKNV